MPESVSCKAWVLGEILTPSKMSSARESAIQPELGAAEDEFSQSAALVTERVCVE